MQSRISAHSCNLVAKTINAVPSPSPIEAVKLLRTLFTCGFSGFPKRGFMGFMVTITNCSIAPRKSNHAVTDVCRSCLWCQIWYGGQTQVFCLLLLFVVVFANNTKLLNLKKIWRLVCTECVVDLFCFWKLKWQYTQVQLTNFRRI